MSGGELLFFGSNSRVYCWHPPEDERERENLRREILEAQDGEFVPVPGIRWLHVMNSTFGTFVDGEGI